MEKPYENDITPLFSILNATMVEECKCPIGSYCFCIEKGPAYYRVRRVDVDLVGSPVVTKPGDSTYRIQIYEPVERLYRKFENDWYDVPVQTEFSLCPTIDDWSREKKYQELAHIYLKDDPYTTIHKTTKKFLAQSSMESYYLQFWVLVGELLKPPKSMESDCPHVGRKKGKHIRKR